MLTKQFRLISSLLILGIVILFTISGRAACLGKGGKNRRAGSSGSGNNALFLINAPTGLTATAVSFTEISLSWQDNSNNEDGFQIETSWNPVGGYYLLATVGANETSYLDAGLVTYTTSYYRVRAFNNIGDISAWSNIASALNFDWNWVPSSWVSIAAGGVHSLAIDNNGNLWSWGRNNMSQLGLGDSYDRIFPVLISNDWEYNPFNSIASVVGSKGSYSPQYLNLNYSFALKTNNTLWAWGANTYGQLALGYTGFPSAPDQAGSESDWYIIAAGYGHILALRSNNILWSCGLNNFGQLGLGDNDDRNRPNQIGGTPSPHPALTATLISLNQIDLSWSDTDNESGFEILRYTSPATQYSLLATLPAQVGTNTTSYSDTTVISNTYSYRIRAFNNAGECLSLPVSLTITDTYVSNSVSVSSFPTASFSSDWSIVSAGAVHNLAIKTSGTLWVWGYNGGYQLGLGDTIMRDTPTQLGSDSDWFVIEAGAGEFVSPPTMTTDRGHSFAMKTNPAGGGTLWAWGSNTYGQLGLGDTIERNTPVQVGTDSDWSMIECGNYHTISLKTNPPGGEAGGTLWSWGRNNIGQLGTTGGYDRKTPTQVGTMSDWSMIAAGNFHGMGLKTDGTIWVWGNNDFGELGLGDTIFYPCSYIPCPLGSPSPVYGFSVVAVSSSQIQLSWDDVSFNESGFIIERTTFAEGGPASGWALLVTLPANTTSYLDEGLTLGIVYYYRISTYNSFGSSPVSAPMNAWPIFFAPTSLAVTAISPSRIDLTWQDNSPDELSFQIERRTPSTDYSLLASVNANTTTYSDTTDLTADTPYSYRVRAYNTPVISSTYTAPVTLTLAAPIPINLIIISPTLVNLLWTDNSKDEFGFKIERKPGPIGTNWEQISITEPNIISYSDSNLISGTMYSYRVFAYNTFVKSEYAGPVTTWESPSMTISWTVIAAGGHALVIDINGNLWAWGKNDYGQLGLGHTNNKIIPTQIVRDWDYNQFGNVDSIAVARIYEDAYSLARKTDGTLWAWGCNNYGQLGLGETGDLNAPKQIGSDFDWSIFCAGRYHSLAIKTTGTLWAWGNNESGKLGLGDNWIDRITPTQVTTEADWSTVTAGRYHSLAIKTTGTLWGWGQNSTAALGLGDTIDRLTPTQVGTDSDWAIITAFGWQSFGIKTMGTLWAWGENHFCTLGLGDTIDRLTPTQITTETDWVAVSAGGNHVIALKANPAGGRILWSWGYNAQGQLGLGDIGINRTTPTQVTTETDWVSIAAQSESSFALKTTGIPWSWGSNSFGRLGLGDTIDRNIPCSLGSPIPASSLVITAVALSQIDLSWADNSNNESGFKIESRTLDTQYSLLATVGADINSYSDTGLNPGKVYYYRVRTYNAMGNSSVSNIAYTDFIRVAPSYLTTAVVLQGGINLFWNDNSPDESGFKIERRSSIYELWDQIAIVGAGITSYSDNDSFITDRVYHYRVRAYNGLGDSPYSNESYIAVSGTWITVSAGYSHTAGIKSMGSLWLWGNNDYGQLGLGDNNYWDYTDPENPIYINCDRYTPAQIGTDTNWAPQGGIACGYYHTLGLKNNGTLWAWGYNTSGQLGLGDVGINRSTPTQIATESDWCKITGGQYHSLALKTNGTIWAWGKNDNGELGLGDTIQRFTPKQIGIDTDWFVVIAGFSHTLGLKSTGALYTWGSNNYGQLGLGDIGINRNTPTQVGTDSDWLAVSGANLSLIAAGEGHSLGLKTAGTLWAWGNNSNGQLGVGGVIGSFPMVRSGHSMVYDPIGNRVIMFGGYGSSGNKKDLWMYDSILNCWEQITTNGLIPSARSGHAMIWNPTAQKVIMFGGNYGSVRNNDLWWYDPVANTWTEKIAQDAVGSPSARNYYSMIWNGTTVIIFGGSTASGYKNDLWWYNPGLNTWTQVTPTGSTPSARSGHAMIWDPMRNIGIMFGGNDGSVRNNDLWWYYPVENIWERQTPVENRNIPYQIGTNSDWSTIAAGNSHILAVNNDPVGGGTLWSWGYNGFGQLGLSDYNNRTIPIQVTTETDLPDGQAGWSIITAGGNHSLALKSTPAGGGTLWSWGYNGDGQLGRDYGSSIIPIPISTNNPLSQIPSNLVLTTVSDTQINLSWTDNCNIETGFKIERKLGLSGTSWEEIAVTGPDVTSYSNTGLSWNTIYYYRIRAFNSFTDSFYSEEINATTAGSPLSLTAMVISSSHIALSWTDTANIETGFKIERKTGSGGSYALLSTLPAQVGTNTVSYSDIGTFASGSYYYRVNAYNDITETVYAYSNEAIIVLSSWVRVAAGVSHSLGIKSTPDGGTLWAWGANGYYGQLGLGDTKDRNTPSQVGTETDWSAIAGGENHTLALKANRTLWAWGGNYYGQLGLGDTWIDRTTPTQVTTETDWLPQGGIIAGANHSLGIKATGTLWAWGYNNRGQLGLGNSGIGTERPTPTQVTTENNWSIATAGAAHSLALKTTGTLWAWGYNYYGQLGDETFTNRTTPRQIGTTSDWSAVIAGNNYSLAIKMTGTLWAWGNNDVGQLGLGNNGTGTQRNTPTQIGTDSDWFRLDAASKHSIAIKTNGTLWAWGYNYYGQLGDGSQVDRNTPCPIGMDSNWSIITANGNRSMAIKTNGLLWVWGLNDFGQLGLGDTIDRIVPTLVGE
jgi:alpha-tubulin suppressor-like RCC1 family protein